MSKNSGYIVEWIDNEGNEKKGIVRYIDQIPSLAKVKKSLIRLINDDHTPKKDEEGKEIVALKSTELLTVKGFID